KICLARAPPVELVMDAMIQVQAAVGQHGADAAEERRVVRDADVLDDADGRDLVVAGVLRQIAGVAILDQASVGEALARDPRRRPLRLRLRQRDAVRPDAVVLRGPDAEAAPAAADVEHALTWLEPELLAHEVELVRLRLLELAVGIAIVCAGVHHQRVEEQGVEVIGHVVVMRDRPRVVLLAAPAHRTASWAWRPRHPRRVFISPLPLREMRLLWPSSCARRPSLESRAPGGP